MSQRARGAAFPMAKRPASTLVSVTGLPLPQAAISADLIAVAPGIGKKGIFTDHYEFTRCWNDALGDAQSARSAVQTASPGLCPGGRVLLDLTAHCAR